MPEGTCGTCGSPIVVRDGKALSVIDRSFIEERDRYREALELIAALLPEDARAIAKEALRHVVLEAAEHPMRDTILHLSGGHEDGSE